MIFENQQKVKTERSGNDIIYKSVSVAIDFQCQYDNTYNDIEADAIAITGNNIEVDAEDGEGKFTFSLQQYKDANFTVKAEPNDAIKLGSKLHFQLAMDNPVSGLTYSLVGEV